MPHCVVPACSADHRRVTNVLNLTCPRPDDRVMMIAMPVTIREDVVGAPLPTAARVVGVPVTRLVAWANRGLLVPQHRDRVGGNQRRVWSYSFEDLVLGRLIRVVEDDYRVRIGQIARMIDTARSWNLDAPLSSLTWKVENRHLFVDNPTDGATHGDRAPNQAVATEVLNLEQIRTDVHRRLQRPATAVGRTTRRRGVKQRREVFEGTRIPVDVVIEYIEFGCDDDEILASYPSLEQPDIDLVRSRSVSAV